MVIYHYGQYGESRNLHADGDAENCKFYEI